MKKYLLILLFMCSLAAPRSASAQEAVNTMEVPSSLRKVWAGMYHFIEPATGDTLAMLVFNPLTQYPRERFRNKNDEEFYWKTVRDVKRTLPYAKVISQMLLETYEYIDTYRNEKEKRDYMVAFEKETFKKYKPVMKNFTKNQGKMLIKLIYRETNQSSYHIVKAFMGTFKAGFWQTFGKFFGVNLRKGYHPDKDKEDAIIERISTRVEQGTL